MPNKITFTNTLGFDFFPPKPATANVPDWYKKTEEYITGKKDVLNALTTGTVKKCIPVFDAMTAGYIIYSQVDIDVTQDEGKPYYQWASQNALAFHPVLQALLHPGQNGAPYPKWSNPYAIKTPKGYSTLFVPPMHNPNGIFTCFPGIVDTDTYQAPVNFPFTLNDVNWTGVIPAGTPIVQAIPFKRESWEMEIGGQEEINKINYVNSKLMTKFHNRYKTMFWTRKEYR